MSEIKNIKSIKYKSTQFEKLKSFNYMAIPLYSYQKEFLKQMLGFDKVKIKGDAWKLDIVINNIMDEVAFTLKDFDENNNKESEIVLSLDDDEIDNMIDVLKNIKRQREKLKQQ